MLEGSSQGGNIQIYTRSSGKGQVTWKAENCIHEAANVTGKKRAQPIQGNRMQPKAMMMANLNWAGNLILHMAMKILHVPNGV